MIVDFSQETARHLGKALELYWRWCRENGTVAPREVQILSGHIDFLARNGPPRTDAVISAGVSHRESMTDELILSMTYKDVAQRLRLSERTVRRLVAAGELKVVRIGGAPRVRVADLLEYVESRDVELKGAS